LSPIQPWLLDRCGGLLSVAVLVGGLPSALRSAEGHTRLPLASRGSWTGDCRHCTSPGCGACARPLRRVLGTVDPAGSGHASNTVARTRVEQTANERHWSGGVGAVFPFLPPWLAVVAKARGATASTRTPPPPAKACPSVSRCQNRVTPRTGRTQQPARS